MPGTPGKKAVNNAGFIATLAKRIEGPEAAALAAAATDYRDILAWLGFVPDLEGFEGEGCEQGKTLIHWIIAENHVGDPEMMAGWTRIIRSAIADLADGNLPK